MCMERDRDSNRQKREESKRIISCLKTILTLSYKMYASFTLSKSRNIVKEEWPRKQSKEDLELTYYQRHAKITTILQGDYP